MVDKESWTCQNLVAGIGVERCESPVTISKTRWAKISTCIRISVDLYYI